MTHGSNFVRADGCPSDCRNGQIWNPGSGPYPCPFCTNNGGKGTAR